MGASLVGAMKASYVGVETGAATGAMGADKVGDLVASWAICWLGATLREETKLETFLALSRDKDCWLSSWMRRVRSLSSRASAKSLEPEDMRLCLAMKPDTLRAFFMANCC